MIQMGIAGIPRAKKGKGMDAGIRYLSEIKLDAMEVQYDEDLLKETRDQYFGKLKNEKNVKEK